MAQNLALDPGLKLAAHGQHEHRVQGLCVVVQRHVAARGVADHQFALAALHGAADLLDPTAPGT